MNFITVGQKILENSGLEGREKGGCKENKQREATVGGFGQNQQERESEVKKESRESSRSSPTWKDVRKLGVTTKSRIGDFLWY